MKAVMAGETVWNEIVDEQYLAKYRELQVTSEHN